MKRFIHLVLAASLSTALLGSFLSGCNIFDPIDNPSGDAQILSAARAAFDRGDLEEAIELYGKLSSKDDKVRTEEAFLKLDLAGVDAKFFVSAFGSGSGADGLNQMAADLAPRAGESLRLAIFDALKDAGGISNVKLRGLIRFIAGIALTAEILAEDAGASGSPNVLEKTDIAVGGSSCVAEVLTCSNAGPCDTHGNLIQGNTAVLSGNDLSGVDLKGPPHLGMLNGAIGAVFHALENEIEAGGDFSSGTGSFFEKIKDAGLGGALDTAPGARCYRALLIEAGVGV